MPRIWAYPVVHLCNTSTDFERRINTVFNKTFTCVKNKPENKKKKNHKIKQEKQGTETTTTKNQISYLCWR